MSVCTCVLGFSVDTWARLCDAPGSRVALGQSAPPARAGSQVQTWGRGFRDQPLLAEHLVSEGSREGGPADPTPLTRLLHPLSPGGCSLAEALHYHP